MGCYARKRNASQTDNDILGTSQLPPLDRDPDLPLASMHTANLVDYCPELMILNSNTTMGLRPSLLRS